MKDNLWWGICWFMLLVVSALPMCACIPHTREPQLRENVGASDGLIVIDLSGEPVDSREVADVVREVAEGVLIGYHKKDIESFYQSLRTNPIQAFIAPTNSILCTHTADGEKHARCWGYSYPGALTMFVTKQTGAHLACGSLVHELAHEMFWRLRGDADGLHKKFALFWNQDVGAIHYIKVKFNCPAERGTMRVWE